MREFRVQGVEEAAGADSTPPWSRLRLAGGALGLGFGVWGIRVWA